MPEGSTNRDKRRAKRADGVTNDLLNDRLKTRLINQVTSFLSGSQNNPEMTVAILCTYERISKELDLEIAEGLGILLSEVNPEERYYFNQTYQHYANNQIDRGISVLNWPVYEDIEANLEA
ncbi:hypothetical protein KC678_00665, partial [Candidatus Dojkabacteria bacterium]|nr:hypothetical protein [Candidatus Dojkabacteria bacterium]